MAPIYDTDLEQERWDQEEWKNFELWEKIELKLRKKKNLIIAGAIFVFFILSSIPVVMDRSAYWQSVTFSSKLASELNLLKQQALTDRVPYRFRFLENSESGEFIIEKLENCKATEGVQVRKDHLFKDENEKSFKRLTPELAQSLGFGTVSNSFCFSPLEGAFYGEQNENKSIFAFMHVKDLTLEHPRLDRISILTVEKLTAEISFN